MFVGHYAPALLARAAVPESRLWTLFVAAQALDIGFDALGLVGVERVALREGVRGPLALELQWMPYTHSLLSAVVLGGVCAAVGWGIGRRREGLAIGLVVASHWFVDLLVHVPDLHLGLGAEPRLGLGLWSWPALAVVLELGLLIAAGAVFVDPPRARSAAARGAHRGVVRGPAAGRARAGAAVDGVVARPRAVVEPALAIRRCADRLRSSDLSSPARPGAPAASRTPSSRKGTAG